MPGQAIRRVWHRPPAPWRAFIAWLTIDFFRSLDRFKANKGLFVTTSAFSQAAKETADMLSKRIVLIDGLLLTRLMIRFDIGCRVEEVVYIKKLDEDFFD
jgi:restriction system protein